MKIVWTFIALLAATSASATAPDRHWRFDVSLDDKPIGYHNFELHEHGKHRQLRSEARFNVKVLFVSVYKYEHDNLEQWQGDCLRDIDAVTDDNGRKRSVHGKRDDSKFLIDAGAERRELEACVMTFAYWNPLILEATHLLNPQTGDYVPVTVTRIGQEALTTGHATLQSERYRLTGHGQNGEPLQIDLWYSLDKQWLALESVTPDGHRLRYGKQ